MKMKSKKKKEKETLDVFLSRVEQLNNDITIVTENVNNLQIIQKKIIGEPSQAEREKLLAILNDLVHQNKVTGRKIQKQIKEEQQKNKKLEKDETATDVNIRNTQVQSAAKRFLDVWTEYNNAQLEFRDKNKKALLRNIKITDPSSNITVEEIEEKLDAGDVTVLSSIIKETNQAKEDLKMLENRHAEMLKLEKGISEVHEMFLDLSNMVNMQGEMVDRIDNHMSEAHARVEEGRKQLGEAEKKKRSARRKKFILAGILAGISLIVILILIITFL